jgi:hypothetical protein
MKYLAVGLVSMVFFLGTRAISVQDQVHYSGRTSNNPDYHHGQLSPVTGKAQTPCLTLCC